MRKKYDFGNCAETTSSSSIQMNISIENTGIFTRQHSSPIIIIIIMVIIVI